MKIIALTLFLCLCLSAKSKSEPNQNKGIEWTENLSWQQIMQKAKAENKYVFVDCYTTWCAPCKQMSKEVFPNPKVGAAVNAKFIAVKVQMDVTDKDNEEIKQWYNDAKTIETTYKVASYPSLLFFSPEGKLVHRASQGYNVEGFLDLVSIALDPKKQYYVQLEAYKSGKRDIEVMIELALATRNLGDKELANQIATDCLSMLKPENLMDDNVKFFLLQFSELNIARALATKYINKIKESDIYKESNLVFISKFTRSSKDRGFKIFYNGADKVNRVMDAKAVPAGMFSFSQKGDFAQSLTRYIIFMEDVYKPILEPALKSKTSLTPDWIALKNKIKSQYPKADVELIIIDSKLTWYSWKKDWDEYSKSLVEKMENTYSIGNLKSNGFFINNQCWDLFENATDLSLLNRAIYWMELTFKESKEQQNWSTALDTYANLLYKVGRVNEALEWQAKAVKLTPDDKGNLERYEKMKKGEPTWPQQKTIFSGTWKINLSKSEYGQAPVNTLIKEIKVDQKSNQITIERKAGDQGKEISATETLTFDGKTYEQTLDGKVKKSSVKWSPDAKQLIETALYDYEQQGMDRTLTESWSLSTDGKLLTIVRNFELEGGIKYTTKCVYEKVE